MVNRIQRLLTLAVMLFIAGACSVSPGPTRADPSPEATFTPSPARTPATEAEVPRLNIAEAKAALDSGAAVVVDVRSPAAFAMSHIAGAVSLPLADIETNPTGLQLDKDEWIITYCT